MSASAAPAPVAVVLPILNEAKSAGALAAHLASLTADRAHPVEIIIVDGGSDDGGAERLRDLLPSAAHLVVPRGRARQMNAGARATSAPVLLFLHADTRLPPGALASLSAALDGGAGFGCFSVEIDSPDPRLRLAARLINLRSRHLCSATGDQAIFVRRDLFAAAGGFPEIALCEDLALMARLCGRAPFACVDPPVVTSARRWQRHGVTRTIARMWCIRIAFHLGVPPARLARYYAHAR